MNLFLVVLLSIVQGVTEFLPISSSGHLSALSMLFGINKPSIFFTTVLHAGTLVSVIIAFWDDIKSLLISLLKKEKKAFNYILYIFVTTIITAVIGFSAESIFKSSYSSIIMISIFWFITGLILFTIDKISLKQKKLTIWIAVIIGIAQAFAIFPGISRSGMTLAAALFMGLQKKEAISYIFLISIPAIVGANIVEVMDININNLLPVWYYIIGFVLSAVVGYLSIVLLVKLVRKRKLKIFSFYLIPLSIIIFIYNIM